jgi:membrane dipeptidase
MVGIDHLAVGTDFTENQSSEFFDWILAGKSKKGPAIKVKGPIIYPQGIQCAADFPNITKALMVRGYSVTDVKKIMGENILRIFKEVWAE